MVLVGSDDGAYRLTGNGDATRVLDSGPVMRLKRFDTVDGVFAATTTGLYRSSEGEEWTDLGVPREEVYAVDAGPDGRLYAGTRPAHLYVADDPAAPAWRELEGFQALSSREDWGLPRHDYIAQVRDVHALPDRRVVAGVEVGGVHASDDGGETWTGRRDGVNDDVHELHAVTDQEYVAATGFGLFHTSDAGRTWTRLDDDFDQRYFRRAFSIDGVVYAAGALANSSTWEDDDADPALFAYDGDLRALDVPFPDETVTGMTAADGDLAVATHRGNVFVRGDGWTRLGSVPVSPDVTGRYTPLVTGE